MWTPQENNAACLRSRIASYGKTLKSGSGELLLSQSWETRFIPNWFLSPFCSCVGLWDMLWYQMHDGKWRLCEGNDVEIASWQSKVKPSQLAMLVLGSYDASRSTLFADFHALLHQPLAPKYLASFFLVFIILSLPTSVYWWVGWLVGFGKESEKGKKKGKRVKHGCISQKREKKGWKKKATLEAMWSAHVPYRVFKKSKLRLERWLSC